MGYQSTDERLLSRRREQTELQDTEPDQTLTDTPTLASTAPTNPSLWRSLQLENKGTVARDHLANERTFLAWLRTSLSFISLGIGVAQLFRVNGAEGGVKEYGKPLGSVFIILGISTLVLGFCRFFHVQTLLTRNHFPATRLSIITLISVVATLVVVTFGLVLKAT